MSAQPTHAPRQRDPKSLMKLVASAAVIGALAFGATALVNRGDTTPATTAAAPQAAAGQVAPAAPPAGARAGAPPGRGTPVTGATATKLEAAATAKYPGTVEQAMALPDGSYVVHVFQSDGSGEVHVLVSSAFEVTGVQTGGRGGRPPGAAGQAPAPGQAPPSSGSGSATQS